MNNIPDIGFNLKHQDNRITSDPIFIVFVKDVVPTDPDYSDQFYYIDGCNDNAEFRTVEEVYEFHGMEVPDPADEDAMLDYFQGQISKIYYIEKPRFVTACFTEKGAMDYIAANGHNLREPYVFVDSLYRNREMIDIRNALKAGHARKHYALLSAAKSLSECPECGKSDCIWITVVAGATRHDCSECRHQWYPFAMIRDAVDAIENDEE